MHKSKAICILGMHRSGTSSVARGVNLLGVSLGKKSQLGGAGEDNPTGFWENQEISNLETRLLTRLGITWDTTKPLPKNWLQSEAVRPFNDELSELISSNFDSHLSWAWKHPQTCLLLPLWREVLEKSNAKLSCLFVFRNPSEVASSLFKRDFIPLDKAIGIWFHYNIVALENAAGLPIVFLNYDRFLADWETELRRCSASLDIEWPREEEQLLETMSSFLKPSLRHHVSTPDKLQELPLPVRELFHVLLEAGTEPFTRDSRWGKTIHVCLVNFMPTPRFLKVVLICHRPVGQLASFNVGENLSTSVFKNEGLQ